MKNDLHISWLPPLIETENCRNVLIVGNIKENILKECLNSVSILGGNLIVSTNKVQEFNEDIIYCSSDSSRIFPVLQLKRIKLDLILVDTYIDGLEKLLKSAVRKKCLIFVNKSIKNNEKKKIETFFECLFETNCYYVFSYNNNIKYYEGVIRRILSVEDKETRIVNKNKPIVGVGVLTYNHEKYISECLNSIFKQKGNFEVHLIIIDDCSPDRTASIVDDFLAVNKSSQIKVKFIRNVENKGMINNLKILMQQFRNTDYFTFCEGDDYWVSDFRIQKFVDYMKLNPFVSVAFNALYLYDETEFFKKNENHFSLMKRYFNTRDLIKKYNLIGNFSCCFYDSIYLDVVKEDAYQLTLYDLLFNEIYSNFGFIGYLDDCLSVYRYHENSVWSSKKQLQKNLELYTCIDQYNQYGNFMYDKEYRRFQNSLFVGDSIPTNYIEKDLVIIDNIFPCELSQFDYQEITSYLQYYENSICLSNGLFLSCFKNCDFDEEIQKFKRSHLDLCTKMVNFTDDRIRVYNPKLLYFIFLNSVKLGWNYILEKKKPFVFELYPGGGFAFNDPESDYVLKTAMASKYFKKVIVTQTAIRDYLLEKKFCKSNQIELIFGVVMPLAIIESNYIKKANYGINKKTLDIVFMAHKYTERGVDKGYDVFIDVAHILSKKYLNVYFHVVGGFSESDIDITSIQDKIKFYGSLSGAQLDEFFADKDMILSPNIPNKIFQGSFDGFPTASCIEAGIRKTALFCTDPLLMNQGNFEEKKEIEIIEYDVEDIFNRIEYYYHHPNQLKMLGLNGAKAIQRLYSYESQIKPRIEVLNKVLGRKDSCEKNKN